MKIALVHAPCWGTYMPPLGIAYLSSMLKKQGHKPIIFDLNIRFFDDAQKYLKGRWKTGKLDFDKYWTEEKYIRDSKFLTKEYLRMWAEKIIQSKAEIIGFSVVYTQKLTSLLLAEEIKKLDAEKIIIFGGYDCYHPQERLQMFKSNFVDGIVIGEGEVTLSKIVNSFEDKGEIAAIPGLEIKVENDIIRGTHRKPIMNLDDLPFPDFTDFPLKKYRKGSLPILMSKGCINKCVFCIEHIFGGPFRCRSAENVFNEMRYQKKKHKKNYFNFNDSLINGNIKVLDELCNLLIENDLQVEWEGNARISPCMTEDLLKKMYEAGCRRLVYGIESGSQKVINSMGKNFYIKVAEDVLKNTHNAGIEPVTNWMIGFPNEKRIDFLKTLLFIFKNRSYLMIGPPWGAPTVLIPETYVSKNYKKFGILNHDGYDWYTRTNNPALRRGRVNIFRTFTRILGCHYPS